MNTKAPSILPPLSVMTRWRDEGYTPQEVYQMSVEYVAKVRRVITDAPKPAVAPLPLRRTLPPKPLATLESGFIMVLQAIVDTGPQSSATAIATRLKMERLEVQKILVKLYRAGYVMNLRRPSLTESGMNIIKGEQNANCSD